MRVIDFYIPVYLYIYSINEQIPNDLVRYIFEYIIYDVKVILMKNYLYKDIMNHICISNLPCYIKIPKEQQIIYSLHIDDKGIIGDFSIYLKNMSIDYVKQVIDELIKSNNLALKFSHYCCVKSGICYILDR